MSGRGWVGYGSVVAMTAGLFLASCAHDTYKERADLVKDHAESFYSHLKANRVESAIRENEQIEAMASQMGETVKKRAAQQALRRSSGNSP
jgi:ABC-type transporter MlaC component